MEMGYEQHRGAGAGDRVGCEFSANAANRTFPLGTKDGGSRATIFVAGGFLIHSLFVPAIQPRYELPSEVGS